MATKNPTDGGQLMPLDLPAEHVEILRDRLTSWLNGLREELRTPERLEDPDSARQEAQSYERLLVSLTTGQIVLPDELAHAAIQTAASTHDTEGNYDEVAASHDALHGLLAVLGGAEGSGSGCPA
jgi:hypothetical protein